MRQTVTMAALVVSVAVLSGCVVASTSSDGDGGGLLLLLFAVVLFFIVIAVARRSGTRRGSRWAGESAPDRPNNAMLRAEVSVLAHDVVTLEPRVALCDAAREDFDAATHRYRVAEAALDASDAEIDLVRLQRVVDEATWSMARVRAILDGRKPPEPPARLQRPGHHGEPAIQLDAQEHPAYVGSPAEFRSGWFGGSGGLFGGLLLGTMLGGFGGWVTHEEESDFGEGAGDAMGDW